MKSGAKSSSGWPYVRSAKTTGPPGVHDSQARAGIARFLWGGPLWDPPARDSCWERDFHHFGMEAASLGGILVTNRAAIPGGSLSGT